MMTHVKMSKVGGEGGLEVGLERGRVVSRDIRIDASHSCVVILRI